ncbi:IclR family transcriptional regulator [Achromobacter sp. DH1f]|uniref:IclR family transcriptional regulator n=1 Tax=Achromobacter sp. DH1f TaxID=1397275 RepID=UPI00046A1298|nr:IclR family transcriptional regulator [Achromobacter sp. DH1f]
MRKTDTADNPASGGSQTVDRALQVLRTIIAHGKPISLDDIAGQVQLHKSVTYRLVRSLEHAGFIGRDAGVGGYSVGPELLSLSVAIASRVDIRRAAKPFMEQIVRTYGETVSLHVRSGDLRVCVEVVEGTFPIRRVVPVGEVHPVYAGESGRVLLSGMSEPELHHQLTVASQNGLDRDAVLHEVQTVRKQGWIAALGLRTPDVGSVSVPVHGLGGVVGALTVSGPATRWSVPTMKAAIPTILAACKSIDEALNSTAQHTSP